MNSEQVDLDMVSEIQMAASRWVIDRKVCDAWSVEEQANLDNWLNASVANRIAYLRADMAWSRTARAAALRQPAPDANAKSPVKRPRSWHLKWIASLGVVALLGAGAAQYFYGPHYVAYATPVGGHEILTLSDGSQLELNTDSAVRVADGSDARQVIVEKGEVYFDIRHDHVHPFVVLAQGRQINDLGTKFVVREKSDRLEIALLEGRVRVDAPDGSGKPATNMKPGDVAVATSRSTVVSRRQPENLSVELSWRQGVLTFHHTALAEAVAEFNRYNSRKVVVADAKVGQLEINGKFRTNDVDMFTDVTADILGLHVEKLADKILMGR